MWNTFSDGGIGTSGCMMSWADVERRDPFCDTCDNPAYWSETVGWVHFIDGKPIYPNFDSSDHKVTVSKWSEQYD